MTIQVLTEEERAKHLDAVLRASGSALKNYSMHKTLTEMDAAISAIVADVVAKLAAGELPEPSRGFFCTKCGSNECEEGTIKQAHPPCAKCGYLGFASDTGYTADQLRLVRAQGAAAMLNELESAQKDAERYRWLRNGGSVPDGGWKDGEICVKSEHGQDTYEPGTKNIVGDELDAAIDAAMESSK